VKRALLIGVDDYDNFGLLDGCVNDVRALLPLLARNEDDTINFSCVTLDSGSGGRVLRDEVLEQVRRLLSPGADVALLYFAGHGMGEGDDVTLCTTDGTSTTPGVKMSEVLTEVTRSAIPEVNIVLDCCFSGAAGAVPQLAGVGSFIRSGLSILAASRGDQPAEETPDGRGLFSWHVCAALNAGAADIRGSVTLAGIWAYLSECFGAWDQRPTLKASIDRPHVLRTCAPAVPDDVLRELAVWFPDPAAEFPLDPSFEDSAEPRDPGNEAVFKKLQRCSYVKLVEPVDEEYMYYAAMNSKSCRLTPLGQHYRHLAAKEIL
jgi:hypothetical protein